MSSLLALCASVLIGTGAALQQRAANEEDPHAVMDPRLVFGLLRRRTWVLGILTSISGFALQATAIATGRLVVVAPIMAMHVLIALIVSARHAGRRLGPREWRGAVAALVGVGGFLAVASPTEGVDVTAVVPWIVPLTVVAGAIVAGVLFARTLPSLRRGLPLAVLAGLGFGTADALIKLFTGVGSDEGVAGVFGHWGIWAWLVISPTAFLLQQSAFHASHLGAALPGAATLGPTTAAVLGALMFGERIRLGWAVPAEVALAALMLVGVALLASSPLLEAEPAPAIG